MRHFGTNDLLLLAFPGFLWLGGLRATAQTKIFWTATEASGAAFVMSANGDGSNPTSIVSGPSNIKGPNGLEYGNGFLYWTDQQLTSVMRVKPDGTELTPVLQTSNPYDVVATPQRIYWTSLTRNSLTTALLDGSDAQRLLQSPEISQPFAIEATDSNLYWSQVSGLGIIRRSDLNGGNIVTIIPNAYVYDFQLTPSYIYYGDLNGGSVKRANLDGSGVITLVQEAGFVNGIFVTADALYWSALDFGIRRANLDGSNVVSLYDVPSGTQVRGIVVIPAATPAGPRLGSPTAQAGSFTFSIELEIGKTYRIQNSANFIDWTDLTNFVSATATMTLTNPVPTGAAALFFRASSP